MFQVFQGTAGLVEEAVNGRLRQVSAALVEVLERYISQGEMLSEIQALHSRYIFFFIKVYTFIFHESYHFYIIL